MVRPLICLSYHTQATGMQCEFDIQKKMGGRQGTIHWRASSNPDFIQNYSLLKCMFDFFDNRDKCRKPGFLRGNIYSLLAFLWFF